MQLKEIEISELKEPYSFKNYNKHPKNHIEVLGKSLEKFLQYKNIVMWKDNQVIAGNGLIEAAKNKKYKTLFVVDMSHLSKKQAMELLITDNVIVEGSEPDFSEMSDMINDFELEIPGIEFVDFQFNDELDFDGDDRVGSSPWERSGKDSNDNFVRFQFGEIMCNIEKEVYNNFYKKIKDIENTHDFIEELLK